MRDAVRERVGLAGAGAGDHEEWPLVRLRRFALAHVEPFKGRRSRHCRNYRLLLYILPVRLSGANTVSASELMSVR